MSEFLFYFGFTWPEEVRFVDEHPEADLGEASAAVLVTASNEEDALEMGEELAERFVECLYGERAYSWREGRFARWLESDVKALLEARRRRLPVCRGAEGIAGAVKDMVRFYDA